MSGDQRKDPRFMRDPPAYQCYAADEMASEVYVLMSLAERGLRASMRNACWSNGSVPRDPVALARIVRTDVNEVKEALTTPVLNGFVEDPSDPTRLVCPELQRHRAELLAKRARQAEGGAKGGRATQERARETQGQPSRQPSRQPSSLAKGLEVSGDELSGDELQRPESVATGCYSSENKRWVEEYDRGTCDVDQQAPSKKRRYKLFDDE